MNLDENTYLKVLNIFKTNGFNSVSYCGCWSENTISFEVTNTINGETKAGLMVTIDHDFNIKSLRRLSYLLARNIYGGPKNSGYKKVWERVNYPIVLTN